MRNQSRSATTGTRVRPCLKVLYLLVADLLIKVFAKGIRRSVRDIWLVFDFLIVAISLAFTYVEKVKFGDVKAGSFHRQYILYFSDSDLHLSNGLRNHNSEGSADEH
jgi:hypothetical protein